MLTTAIQPTGRWREPDIITMSMKTLPHILLIDDDEIFIFLTRKMLQSTGKTGSISICRSATEAITFLHTAEVLPDMILLDLNMPGMNGWEFLQHYQFMVQDMADPPRLYVVSSSIASDDAERAKKIKGVNGYMAKPLTGEGIRQMLRETTAS